MSQSTHNQISTKNGLENITKKKERIDALVEIAKKEYDARCSYEKIMQTLDLEMTVNWALSSASKREYLKAVKTTFEYTYGIRLMQEEMTSISEIDHNDIKTVSKRSISKIDLFFNTLKSLEGEEKDPVSHNIFKSDLIKTGRFTEEEAEKYIMRMRLQSAIYESKPGRYNIV